VKFALFDLRLSAALNTCCGETVVCSLVSATWRSTHAAFQQLLLHMSPENFLAFIGTTAVLTVTPGLDTAVVLRTAALSGSRHGIFAALGIGVGLHVTQR